MTTRQILISVVLLAVIGFGTLQIINSLTAPDEAPPRNKNFGLREVEAVMPVRESEDVLVREYGYVSTVDKLEINAEASGKLLKTNIKLANGVSFNKGDLLVSIDSKTRALNLKALKSDYINQVNSVLPDLKVDYPGSFPKWEKYAQGLSIDKPLPAPPETSSASENAFISRNNIYKSYHTILSEEEVIKRHRIYAPFDGSLSNVKLQTGSNVNTGTNIATAIRTDLVEVAIPLKKTMASNLKLNKTVNLILENGTQVPGRVSRISDFINTESQTQMVYIEVKNAKKNQVFSGDYVQVQIPVTTSTQGAYVSIPRSAILRNNNIFTINTQDSTLNLVSVSIKDIIGNRVMVEGLQNNNSLVVKNASESFNSGMKVNFRKVQ